MREMENTTEPKLTFATFLGTNEYVPVHYALGEERTEQWQSYVQAALVELLLRQGQRIGRVVVFATKQANAKHWEKLYKRLSSLLPGLLVEVREIPDGANEKELWGVFEILTDALAPGERVVFDTTHGFRSLPIVATLASSYLRQSKDVSIQGVFYGAFETLGPAFEVRNRQSALPENDPSLCAPIFDLTLLFALNDWSIAAADWRRTGRALSLATVLEQYTKPLERRLRREKPQALTQLPGALRLLDDACVLVRSDEFEKCTRSVLERLEGAAASLSVEPALAPLRPVLEQLRRTLPEVEPEVSVAGYLRNQHAVARWCSKRGRFGEALTLYRELLTSMAVVVSGEKLPAKNSQRELAENVVGWFAPNAPNWRLHPSVPRAMMLRVALWFQQDRERHKLWSNANNALEIRNKIHHAWTDVSTAGEFSKGSSSSFAKSIEYAEQALAALLQSVVKDLTEETQEEYAIERVGFANVSNHLSASWSEAQLAGAKKLGEGTVIELGFPAVDPAGTLESVEFLSVEWSAKVFASGARCAHVAGEPTLVAFLVPRLQRLGIVCYSATTARDVRELQTEKGVEKTSVFRFVQWREFPRAG